MKIYGPIILKDCNPFVIYIIYCGSPSILVIGRCLERQYIDTKKYF